MREPHLRRGLPARRGERGRLPARRHPPGAGRARGADDAARAAARIRAGRGTAQPDGRALEGAAPAVGRDAVRQGHRHPRRQGAGRQGVREPGDGARRPPPRGPGLLPEPRRGRRGRAGLRRGGGNERRGGRPSAAGGSARARGLHRPALPGCAGALDADHQRGREPGADRGAVRAGRRAGECRAPAARTAAPVARDGAAERRHPARAAAGRGRLAAGPHPGAGRGPRPRPRQPGHVPHRVLRHFAHGGRGDAGFVRGVPSPQDAERRVPALQHRRHHARGRLRRDAPGAAAPLQPARGSRTRCAGCDAAQGQRQRQRWRRRPPARPGAGGRRQGAGEHGARGFRGTGPGPVGDRRRGEGRGAQGGPRGTGVRRRPRQGVPRTRLGGADAGGADPGRGAPVRHHRHARPARARAGGRQPARGDSRHRRQEAGAPAAAVRRRGGGARRRGGRARPAGGAHPGSWVGARPRARPLAPPRGPHRPAAGRHAATRPHPLACQNRGPCSSPSPRSSPGPASSRSR